MRHASPHECRRDDTNDSLDDDDDDDNDDDDVEVKRVKVNHNWETQTVNCVLELVILHVLIPVPCQAVRTACPPCSSRT